jgi:hypothetical protein
MIETVRGAGYRLTAMGSPARQTPGTPLSAT